MLPSGRVGNQDPQVSAGDEVARRISAAAARVYHSARSWDAATATAAAQPSPDAGALSRHAMVQSLHPDGTATFEARLSALRLTI